ncbi:hypothetical protein F5B18DRAFT_653735 [Nemania serpens]|nr:hypothetical protein F5B18DRAFT_653735 [Nemania serpens]
MKIVSKLTALAAVLYCGVAIASPIEISESGQLHHVAKRKTSGPEGYYSMCKTPEPEGCTNTREIPEPEGSYNK